MDGGAPMAMMPPPMQPTSGTRFRWVHRLPDGEFMPTAYLILADTHTVAYYPGVDGGWTAFHGEWQDVPEGGKRIRFSFRGNDWAAFWHCLREYRTVEGGVYYMGLKQEGGTTHTIFFMLEGEAITLGSGVERATESSLLPHPKRARPDVE